MTWLWFSPSARSCGGISGGAWERSDATRSENASEVRKRRERDGLRMTRPPDRQGGQTIIKRAGLPFSSRLSALEALTRPVTSPFQMDPVIAREVDRRRTFAIISHPDAGKTTLTEKFLLYGGAIETAGSVKARRTGPFARSDWMEIERERGISITSTVLVFEYRGLRVNLLDTPGHQDFSEDTYRVLSAVDAAVMLLDGGRGVQAQTEKLFHVCRRRGIPI